MFGFKDAVVAQEQHAMLLVAICCKGMTRARRLQWRWHTCWW